MARMNWSQQNRNNWNPDKLEWWKTPPLPVPSHRETTEPKRRIAKRWSGSSKPISKKAK